jgi:hypothetical protein
MNHLITVSALFHRIIAELDSIRACYQAFEDHSIRLLSSAPQWIIDLPTLLHAING